MSKRVKNLITGELSAKFKDLDGVAVISPRGIDGIKNNLIRRQLREKNVKMTVVKNTLAKRAIGKSKIAGFEQLLDGSCAVVYGSASISTIARLLMDARKTNEKLELRGIFFDGEVYLGQKGVEQVSKLPTREEAVANLLGAILGPGRKLAASLKGPGGKLGAVLKSIEEAAAKKESAKPAVTETGTEGAAGVAPA